MQIVIDIPEAYYELVISRCKDPVLLNAFKNGKPLPKGHGRLGDLGKIYVELNEAQIEGTEEYKGLGKAKQIVCASQTIIEADKEEEEDADSN